MFLYVSFCDHCCTLIGTGVGAKYLQSWEYCAYYCHVATAFHLVFLRFQLPSSVMVYWGYSRPLPARALWP